MNENIAIIEEKFGKDVWSNHDNIAHIIELSKDIMLIFYSYETDIRLFKSGVGCIKYINLTEVIKLLKFRNFR